MRTRRGQETLGNEYEVVSFRVTWVSCSLGAFVLALLLHSLLDALGWRVHPFRELLLIMLLATLGVGSGLLGLRFSANRAGARISLLLNGVVLGLCLLAAAGSFFVFYR